MKTKERNVHLQNEGVVISNILTDNENLKWFANAAYVGGDVPIGGTIVSGVPEYNQEISKFIVKYLNCYYRLIKQRITASSQTGETEKILDRIKKLSESFVQFLEKNKKLNEKHDKFKKGKIQKEEFFRFDSGAGRYGKFNVYRCRFSPKVQDGDIVFYYYRRNLEEDLIMLIRESYENGENLKELLAKFKLQIAIELLKKLLNNHDQNLHQETKEFLEAIINFFEKNQEDDDPVVWVLLRKLVRIELDIRFDFSDEDNVEDEEDEFESSIYKLAKPIITKLSYGDPVYSYKEAIESIIKSLKKRSIDVTQEEIESEFPQVCKIMKKFYDKSEAGQIFRNRLREDIRKILDLPDVKKVVFVAEKKSEARITRQIWLDHNKYIFLLISEKEIKQNRDKIQKMRFFHRQLKDLKDSNRQKQYLQLEFIKDIKILDLCIEDLFPNWSVLKQWEKDSKVYDGRAIDFLVQFFAFLLVFDFLDQIYKIRYVPVFLLDLEKNDEDQQNHHVYEIWNAARALMKITGIPSQTILLDTIDQFESSNQRDSIIKNAFISSFRKNKIFVFRSDAFERFAREKERVLLLVENRTKELWERSELRQNNVSAEFVYLALEFDFRKKKENDNYYSRMSIRRLNREFVFLSSLEQHSNELQEFLRRYKKTIFISQSQQSPLISFLDNLKENKHDKYFVLYKQTKTPLVLRENSKLRDPNAYYVSHEQISKGLDVIGLYPDNENFWLSSQQIMIKAPLNIPFKLSEYPVVSTTLFMFYIKDPVDDYTFALMRWVLLGWLMYENESTVYLYAKPEFLPVRLPDVLITRKNEKNIESQYLVALSSVIVELKYLYETWKYQKSQILA